MPGKPSPYEPPEHDSEIEDVRNFARRSDWHIKVIFLLPTVLYSVGALVLKVFLSLHDLKLGTVDRVTAWIIFGALALPASVYTADYFRRRDQSSLSSMIVMVCIHFLLHSFIAFGAAVVLLMFS